MELINLDQCSPCLSLTSELHFDSFFIDIDKSQIESCRGQDKFFLDIIMEL